MHRLIVAVVVVAGCHTANPESCELPENQNTAACGGSDSGGAACDDTHPCATGVCKTPPGVCVGCVMNADCTDMASPTCDTGTNTCRPCAAHADCDSDACLDSGECVAATAVLYVEAGQSGDCSQATPCATLAEAIAKLDTTHVTIKINKTGGPVMDTVGNLIDGKTATILADPGAQIANTTTQPVLTVKNANADVSIFDLELAGTSANGDGITVAGGTGATAAKLHLERVIVQNVGGVGIVAAGPGPITIKRCIVMSNDGGGGNLQATVLDVENSIFVKNGNGTDTSGGMIVSPKSGSVFQFNTVADNVGPTGSPTGVNCVASIVGATSSIVTGNSLGLQCTSFDFSLFDSAPLMGGTHNMVGVPKFRNVAAADYRKDDFYRIANDSLAVDHGDPAASATTDIDGEMRPKGGGKDMGADEAH